MTQTVTDVTDGELVQVSGYDRPDKAEPARTRAAVVCGSTRKARNTDRSAPHHLRTQEGGQALMPVHQSAMSSGGVAQ